MAATVDVSGRITLSYRNCNDKLPVWCLESNHSSALPVTSLITAETTSSLILSNSTSYSQLLTTDSNSASFNSAIGIIPYNIIVNWINMTYCLLINYKKINIIWNIITFIEIAIKTNQNCDDFITWLSDTIVAATIFFQPIIVHFTRTICDNTVITNLMKFSCWRLYIVKKLPL